jgi:hypothetical protein
MGKTYSFKLKAFRNEKSTVWVRRYAEDVKPSSGLVDRFLADMPDEIKDNYFVAKNAVYHVRDASEKSIEKGILMPNDGALPKVTFVALSTARRMKSQSWYDYDLIVFDEFIESSGGRYLSDEYSIFMDLLETITRLRDDVRVLMGANNVSINNPYFAEWGVGYAVEIPENGEGFRKVGKDVVVQWARHSDEFKAAKTDSPIGRLAAGTVWGQMSIENLSPEDEFYGIVKRPEGASYAFTLKMAQSQPMGVWEQFGVFYVTNKYDSSYPKVVTDQPDGIPLKVFYMKLFESYIMGKLRFENTKQKFDFLNWKP